VGSPEGSHPSGEPIHRPGIPQENPLIDPRSLRRHLMVDDMDCMRQIVGKLWDGNMTKVWVKSVGNSLIHNFVSKLSYWYL
jgi:hypothetical protein